MEEKRTVKLPHNIIMENCKDLTVTGVTDIDRFDEEMIVAYTECGELTIKGQMLHINKLDVQTGEMTVDGQIDHLSYDKGTTSQSKGFWARLLK